MWTHIFDTNFSPSPGGVLAFFGGPEILTDYAVSYDLLIKCLRECETNKRLYKQFVHIWPRALKDRDIPAEFRTVVEQDAKEENASIDCVEKFMASVKFISVESCDGDSLISTLEDMPESSSIYVHIADVYRFSGVRFVPRVQSRSIQGLAMSISVAEDSSSEHAERLVQYALQVAANKKSTIILSFESSGFANESIPDSLKGEKEFAAINLDRADAQQNFRATFRQCLDNAATMTISDVAKLLDATGISKLNTALCKAAVLLMKGGAGLAWQTIEPFFEEIVASDICFRILFAAQCAHAAGKKDIAENLLKRATELDPSDLESLLTLHTLIEQVHGKNSSQVVQERLCTRFPNDEATKAKLMRFYLSNRDFGKARDLAVDLSDDYLAELCDVLPTTPLPIKDFLQAARKMGKEDSARYDLASEAYRRGQYDDAWHLLFDSSASEKVVELQCRVLTHRLLGQNSLVELNANEVELVLKYVSHNPGKLKSRFALENLINDDLEYLNSACLLLALMDRAVSRLYQITMQAPATNECAWMQVPGAREEMDFEDTYDVLIQIISALPPNTATFPGEGTFPVEHQDKATAQLLFNWMLRLQDDWVWSDEENRQARALLLHAISLLSAYLNDPTSDALSMRYSVMAEWMAGRSQESRDMAETALMTLPASQPSFRKWRLALGWLCLAEAFLRCQNPLNALLHMVLCLTAAGDTIPSMKGAKEIFRMCSRVARDIQIYPLAMKYIRFERDVMNRYQIETETDYQLVQMEHAIRTIVQLNEEKLDDLQELVREGCAFLEAEHDNQPSPMLATLASLFSHIEVKGCEINPEHRALFDKYTERVPNDIRVMLVSQANAKPTEKTLRTLAQSVGEANSVDDLCFQGRPLRIAAERAIATAYEAHDIPLFMQASGILTQPALSMALNRDASSGIDTNTLNEWLYRYVDGEPASQDQIQDVISLAASSMSKKRVSFSDTLNLSVESATAIFGKDETCTLLSRDGRGSLYALPISHNGIGEIRCLSPDAWDPARHHEWRKKYPYAYKWSPATNSLLTDAPSTDDVRESLNNLLIDGWEPGEHNIVIPDAGLFGFPFNLIPCGDRFAGQSYRISCAPSLSWLAATRAEARARDGGRAAWMGVPGKRDFDLELVASETGPILKHHGFTIHQGDRPSSMNIISLAILAAHGGVGQWGQFVSITSDGKLRFSPGEFASYFSDCGCVVLFICSAGRSDERHHAGETCSLVTELLEHGVQTVIAPIWPLSIKVPGIWLPEFLAQYTAGETAMNASFAAARKVENSFPNPCAWAAMHLYGDGMLTV